MKVSVFTLGCKTNLYESQQIIAELQKRGVTATSKLEYADVFVVNTCAITGEAEKKSRQAIARAKRLNPDCRVIVVGCASQKNYRQFEDIPSVTFIKGVEGKYKIADQIERVGVDLEDVPSVYSKDVNAAKERSRAFVKIQDGCNNFCSYCIVPHLRGRSRSKRVEDVVREVVAADCAETVLIGIDISQYGKDTGESLSELFDALAQHTHTRIRLGSLEASVVTEETLDALKRLDFCPHFHLSLQSGCDATLRRMNRHYTTAQYAEAVNRIRNVFADAAITTDVIAGFCGETDEEFAQTVKFTEQIGFADIHVFPYSPREGTASYNWNDVDASVKKQRVSILEGVKQRLNENFRKRQLGKIETVIAEAVKDGYCEGYTPNYTRVYFKGKVNSGEAVKVKLTRLFKEGVEGEIL
ncbi:MAG: tRNA (N(6)-L-threonylcarbamoyladenosine(37)-C(2))-methylthiotransferase MtaB [Corallococcus sp.]|nr:tRNA (N(6)-L-threonylcarbamoyladenosine(37)-C(2))-methylthiotransferase MtaB [Corallococcus sp.]